VKGSDRFFVEGVSCDYDGAVRPVANLSVGGFYVACDRPAMKGQVLQLVLRIGARECPVLGRVSWVKEAGSTREADLPVGFGVKISQIALADKVALVDLLRRASAAHGPTRS
jgi:Tfp pilus assembly protein PilZ